MAAGLRRVGVMGAGAVGSLIGGLLERGGYEVVLVGRSAHMEAISKRGLRILGLDEPVVVHPAATTDPSALAGCDIVLLTVKSQDTAAAAQALAPHLASDTPLVSLQNGVRNPESLGQIVGEDRVVAGVVLMGVEYLEPGEVCLSMPGSLILGRMDGTLTPDLEALRGVLDAAIETKLTAQIQEALWAKLIVNLDMPIYALTDREYPQGLSDPAIHRLSLGVTEEGLDVLAAHAIGLGQGPVAEAAENKLGLLRLGHDELLAKLEPGKSPGFKPSALQSVLRGSSSEVPYINGEIIRLAEENGVDAAINRALVRLSVEGASEGLPGFLSPTELEARVKEGTSRG